MLNIVPGMRFGNLVTIKAVGKQTRNVKTKNKKWLCKCDCGNKTIKVLREHLQPKDCGNCKYEEIPLKYFEKAKTNAKKWKQREFSITIEYVWDLFVKQNRKCALSQKEINFISDGRKGGTASLDRIDPTKGYIVGNVQWLHKDVNFMKQDLYQEDYIALCKQVVKYFSCKFV